ncbi:MAG TPA: F0F1 ATP synthase subunit A [Mariprofundaceae bacterium]|nr:F0F1 ATP synthase subunit A [Mariprofundaceae bacterium]
MESLRVIVYHELHVVGVDLSISNTVLFMWLAVLVSCAVLLWMTSRLKTVPGKRQLLAEMLYGFIARIVDSNIRQGGERYLPVMFSLFVFILSCNLIGLLPGAFSPTAQIAVTGTLAVGVFAYATWLRFHLHGWRFFMTFAPRGVPILILPLLIPIELLSFLARPVTLAVRLFANMTSGHTALGVLAVLGFAAPWFLQWLPLGFTAVQIVLEFIIAFIQAYIFVTLACVYIDDALTVH